MAKKAMTNEEILAEIERLKESPHVKAAQENQKLMKATQSQYRTSTPLSRKFRTSSIASSQP